MARPSPGPWKVFLVQDGPNKGKLLGVGEARTARGVTDAFGGLWGDGGQKLANAYLIASAPELLASAKALLSVAQAELAFEQQSGDGDYRALLETVETARAAIAKATGEQSS